MIEKLIDYEPIRTDLEEEASALVNAALRNSSPAEVPQFVHMCGIPGAGKTTYVEKWLLQNQGYSCVQFDSVMEQLSGYRADLRERGSAPAFASWELPARAIGYHLLQALVDSSRNILFDHSATNRMHVDLIGAVKRRNYSTHMHYIQCSPATAMERIKSREKITGRHTPEALIYEREALLQELLPLYRRLVDRFVEV